MNVEVHHKPAVDVAIKLSLLISVRCVLQYSLSQDLLASVLLENSLLI